MVILFLKGSAALFYFNPNLVVYCSPAVGGGTIRKNSHFVSSAIHIKIGSNLIVKTTLTNNSHYALDKWAETWYDNNS